MLLLSDIHFGYNKFNKKKYQIQIEYFQKVLFPYILKNNIKNVIHLGDIVDNPSQIDNELLLCIQNDFIDFFINNNIKLYLLNGNHDSYYKDDTNSIVNFNEILQNHHNNIKAISEPELIYIESTNCYFIPFNYNFDNIPNNIDVIFAHHDVKDVVMSKNNISKHGLELSEINKLNIPVYSGHYHNKSDYNNLHFVGNLFETNKAEINYIKGFHLFEFVDNNYITEFIKNDYSPKHYLFDYIQSGKNKQPILKDVINNIEYNNVLDNIELANLIQNNYITVTSESYFNEVKHNEIIEYISKQCKLQFEHNNIKQYKKAIETIIELNSEDNKEVNDNIKSAKLDDLIENFFEQIKDVNYYNEIKQLFHNKLNKFC